MNEAEWIYQLHPIQDLVTQYVRMNCFPRIQLSHSSSSRQHEAIWNEAETSPMTLPQGARSTMAALLAFGAFLSGHTSDSEKLYAAARQSFLDVMDLVSLESVQLAMQMAVFEINTGRSSSLWSTFAIAARLSHALVRLLSTRICLGSF